jgi:hypothetical protein
MDERISGIILGCVTGDALGSPLEGMSRGHIKSVFGSIESYEDPFPALKGKTDRWKKPGLYTSISQVMIINTLCSLAGTNPVDSIKSGTERGGGEFGIFRHPGALERNLINRVKNQGRAGERSAHVMISCARLAPMIVPSVSLAEYGRESVFRAIHAAAGYTFDVPSIAGMLLLSGLVSRLMRARYDERIIISSSLEAAAELIEISSEDSGRVFESGINPDTLRAEFEGLAGVLSGIERCGGTSDAEKAIYTGLNAKLKTPVTRATVNLPGAIIPYAIFLSQLFGGSGAGAVFACASEGGAAAALCSTAGVITGAIHGHSCFEGGLIDGLVNKKRILSIAGEIEAGRADASAVNDFIESEALLTNKEKEELAARTKRLKHKEKKEKSRGEKEAALTRHVIESWTKMDKSRWKKEKKKLDKKDSDQE